MKRFHAIGVFSLIALLSLILAVGIVACRKGGNVTEPPEDTGIVAPTAPAEVCSSFAGTWDVNLGELTVVQEGCEAEGKLKGTGGGYYALEGHVFNDTWQFSWKGPEGRGHGFFKMDPAGGKFVGEYGEGEMETGKGRWDGVIVK